jgi:hypothetical protein
LNSHIYNSSPIVTAIAPTIGNIRLADARHIAGVPVFHRQSVEMTSIFTSKFREERRLPKGDKAMSFADGSKAAKQRVDKNNTVIGIKDDIVDV